MDVRSGKITGRTIGKNRDGKTNTLQLQVEITDTDDVQTVQLFTESGNDTNPPDGSTVIIVQVGDAWKIGLGVNDGIDPEVDPGEKKLYSSLDGIIKAFIYFMQDGTLQLNGDNDFAVRFNALEAAFNQFKSDYNSHAHGGSGPPNSSTNADISSAKVDSVKLP